jgi:hypothetical protein
MSFETLAGPVERAQNGLMQPVTNLYLARLVVADRQRSLRAEADRWRLARRARPARSSRFTALRPAHRPRPRYRTPAAESARAS